MKWIAKAVDNIQKGHAVVLEHDNFGSTVRLALPGDVAPPLPSDKDMEAADSRLYWKRKFEILQHRVQELYEREVEFFHPVQPNECISASSEFFISNGMDVVDNEKYAKENWGEGMYFRAVKADPEPDKKQKTQYEIRDMVMCADANLDNLATDVPGLKDHPFFKIVKYQLACSLVDDDEEVEPLK